MVSWLVYHKREHIIRDMDALDVAAGTMMVSIGALRRAVIIISLVSADYSRTSVGMNSSTWSLGAISAVVLADKSIGESCRWSSGFRDEREMMSLQLTGR